MENLLPSILSPRQAPRYYKLISTPSGRAGDSKSYGGLLQSVENKVVLKFFWEIKREAHATRLKRIVQTDLTAGMSDSRQRPGKIASL